MPGRFALCTNPRCRADVPYVAGRRPPRFCAACADEYAEVEVGREAIRPEVTAQPQLPKDGRVLPHFLDEQEHW